MSFLGKTYHKGLLELKNRGESLFKIKLTSPPATTGGMGELKIIREKIMPQGREWLLAYPAYFKKFDEHKAK